MYFKRLYQIIQETTVALRKGEKVEEYSVGDMQTTEFFIMPKESEINDNEIIKVDCHFIVVGVYKSKVEKYREELIFILKRYPAQNRLAVGPSYIEVAGIIGDQITTLQFFALGKVLGFWSILTPKTFGFEGPTADKLARLGMINIIGYKP